MITKNHIIKLIYEILYEDPDTMLSSTDELASSDDPGTITFLIMNFGGKVEYFYDDQRQQNGFTHHDNVWEKIFKKYPQRRGWKAGVGARGRIWPKKELCSIYENEEDYVKYAKYFEQMFKELGLNINKFRFEFGDSAEEDILLSWDEMVKTDSPSSDDNLSREDSKEVRDAKEKMAALLVNYHLADPVAKQKIRKELSRLRKIMGATESDLDAALKTAQEKLASVEKDFGSVAQANYMKGAIAEEKIPLYNKTLHPMFWLPNQKLHPDIRKQLLLIAEDFVKNSKMDLQVYDVRFLGSLAGYNYTQSSDVDLHIIVDMKKIGIPEDQIVRFGRGISSKWNDEHDVKIKGHKVEIFIEDISANNRASGIYSLCKDSWLRIPQKQKVQFDKENIKKLYYYFSKKIDDVVATNDLQQMRDVFKQITDIRERGLSTKGEFSVENIVFKILRMKGDIKKLKDATNQQVDKDLSLTEVSLDKDLKNGSWTKPNQNEVSYEFEIDGKVFYVVFGEVDSSMDLEEIMSDEIYSPPYNYDKYAIKRDLEWFVEQYDVRIISFLRVINDPSGSSNVQIKTDIRKDMGNKAVHVYTHVLSSIKKFLQTYKPHFIFMTAPDESRLNIYNLFDKKFAKLVGLERMTEDPIIGYDLPKDVLFYKNKNSSLPSTKNPSIDESSENKDTSSKYFTVKFGEHDKFGKNIGVIYLGDEWFANTYKMPSDWGEHANRWVFNRHTGAMNRNYPADVPSYPSLENLLRTLDIWYEKNKSK